LFVLSWSTPPQLGHLTLDWCNIDKIEAVQRRAVRSVLNDWSHPNTQTPALKEPHPYTIGSSSSMLQFLDWNSLEERRGYYSLVMIYEIVHGLVVIPTTPYLLRASYDTRGHSSKFLVPSTRVNAFRYTVTLLSQLCLGMAYQHTLSNHHQLNASNPGWQNFTLHLQVPSLLIVVFISHTHTPLLHLHTALHT